MSAVFALALFALVVVSVLALNALAPFDKGVSARHSVGGMRLSSHGAYGSVSAKAKLRRSL